MGRIKLMFINNHTQGFKGELSGERIRMKLCVPLCGTYTKSWVPWCVPVLLLLGDTRGPLELGSQYSHISKV